eukprot:NODE_314_length_11212_cov_0.272924.p8 type:complete len:120 gc:universal NODE_314_length_11212_cov_0.272924:1264-905(-)
MAENPTIVIQEDNKHIIRVTKDSPGMGESSAVAHYSKDGCYFPLNINNLKCLGNKLKRMNDTLPNEISLESLIHQYVNLFSAFVISCYVMFTSISIKFREDMFAWVILSLRMRENPQGS